MSFRIENPLLLTPRPLNMVLATLVSLNEIGIFQQFCEEEALLIVTSRTSVLSIHISNTGEAVASLAELLNLLESCPRPILIFPISGVPVGVVHALQYFRPQDVGAGSDKKPIFIKKDLLSGWNSPLIPGETFWSNTGYCSRVCVVATTDEIKSESSVIPSVQHCSCQEKCATIKACQMLAIVIGVTTIKSGKKHGPSFCP